MNDPATHDVGTDTSGTGTPDEPIREYRGAGIMWSAIAVLVVLAAFIIVVIQNSESVPFDFLWITVDTPLALIIAVAVAASLAIGEIIGWAWRRHRRSDLQRREELRRLKRSK
ncbi:MAG: lipopolysaccharide assembly protein LapA domain-containing protein [Acidimicrobiales bacterium]